MEEDKTQGKEGEDEGVFFGFGDDLAVDNNPHRAVGVRRKPRTIRGPHFIIEGSRKEIADGLLRMPAPVQDEDAPLE